MKEEDNAYLATYGLPPRKDRLSNLDRNPNSTSPVKKTGVARSRLSWLQIFICPQVWPRCLPVVPIQAGLQEEPQDSPVYSLGRGTGGKAGLWPREKTLPQLVFVVNFVCPRCLPPLGNFHPLQWRVFFYLLLIFSLVLVLLCSRSIP